MIIGIVTISAAVVFILLMVLKKKTSVATQQNATVTLQTITATDECEFENQLQALLDELSPLATYYLNERTEYFKARRRCLRNRYVAEQFILTESLTDLFKNIPKPVTRSKRFKKIRKSLLFDIECEEPMRFFTIVQSIHDEYSFIRLYNLIIEKGYEERCRARLQNIASSYCTIRYIMNAQNKVETEYEIFKKFVEKNALLIESIDS